MMYNRLSLICLIFLGFLTCLPSFGQSEIDDRIHINQVNSTYPNATIRTYQGLFLGGHPNIYMQNLGGTVSNPLATPSGSTLGVIIYSGYDGVDNVQVGRIGVTSKGEFSQGNHPSQMYFNLGGGATCCGTTRMVIDGISGNVGIGTTTPDTKLSVNGNIRAQEIKLETDNWPDYVFEEEYELMSIEDLDAYIRKNKHLPGFQTAEAYEREGMDVAELNQKLLQKIEELSLYVIQLKDEVELLKKQIKK